MTTPEINWGAHAGPDGSAQREQYLKHYGDVAAAQRMNAEAIQRMAQSGVAGADLIAQMTRITCLVDTLFGTLEGEPGLLDLGESLVRLQFESLCQRRIAETLANVQQMVQQAQQASGQTHQRQSGLIVAGRGTKVDGSK